MTDQRKFKNSNMIAGIAFIIAILSVVMTIATHFSYDAATGTYKTTTSTLELLRQAILIAGQLITVVALFAKKRNYTFLTGITIIFASISCFCVIFFAECIIPWIISYESTGSYYIPNIIVGMFYISFFVLAYLILVAFAFIQVMNFEEKYKNTASQLWFIPFILYAISHFLRFLIVVNTPDAYYKWGRFSMLIAFFFISVWISFPDGLPRRYSNASVITNENPAPMYTPAPEQVDTENIG